MRHYLAGAVDIFEGFEASLLWPLVGRSSIIES